MSDNPCGHDQRFGLMLLPMEDNGCLACAFEHSVAREKSLRAELGQMRTDANNADIGRQLATADADALRAELAKANERANSLSAECNAMFAAGSKKYADFARVTAELEAANKRAKELCDQYCSKGVYGPCLSQDCPRRDAAIAGETT